MVRDCRGTSWVVQGVTPILLKCLKRSGWSGNFRQSGVNPGPGLPTVLPGQTTDCPGPPPPDPPQFSLDFSRTTQDHLGLTPDCQSVETRVVTILFEHQAMVKPFSSRTTPNEVFSSSGLSGVIRGQSGFGVTGDLPVCII